MPRDSMRLIFAVLVSVLLSMHVHANTINKAIGGRGKPCEPYTLTCSSKVSGLSSGIECSMSKPVCDYGTPTVISSLPFSCTGTSCTPPSVNSLVFTKSNWAYPNQLCAQVSGQTHCWDATDSTDQLTVIYKGQCNSAGNFCGDVDHDGVLELDGSDKFPTNAAAAADTDGDGMPDDWLPSNPYGCTANTATCNGLVLDADDDNDGVLDVSDNCRMVTNIAQADDDKDGFGNACDSDGPGRLDTSFQTAPGTLGSGINGIAVQTDGKIVLVGKFFVINGYGKNNVIRLNTNGAPDTGFNAAGSGITLAPDELTVSAVAQQADGKILIGGSFSDYNGVARNGIARLNANGSLDTTFPDHSDISSVDAMVLQPDGKILIGGSFAWINSIRRNYIARLNSNGSIDMGFGIDNAYTGVSNRVYAIALQTDGKVIIGGDFTAAGGNIRNYIARLNVDGSLDMTYNPSANAAVKAAMLQADGKVVIAGQFTAVNGVARNHVARLNVDGSLDATFNPDNGATSSSYAIVNTVAIQADGKIVIGGTFSNYDGVAVSNIARLNTDGSLDADFLSGSGVINLVYSTVVASSVNASAVQPDGKLIFGGKFTLYDNRAAIGFARVHTGDTDGDGIENAGDGFSFNAAASVDVDRDGFPDSWNISNSYGCTVYVLACNGLRLDPDTVNKIMWPLNSGYKGSAIREYSSQ